VAGDHEIEVPERLIAALTQSAAVCAEIAGSAGADAPACEARRRSLRKRAQGLDAQVRALGGRSGHEGLEEPSWPQAYVGPSAASAPTVSMARVDQALVAAFQRALDDRRLSESTRAAITTAWAFMQAEGGDARGR